MARLMGGECVLGKGILDQVEDTPRPNGESITTVLINNQEYYYGLR